VCVCVWCVGVAGGDYRPPPSFSLAPSTPQKRLPPPHLLPPLYRRRPPPCALLLSGELARVRGQPIAGQRLVEVRVYVWMLLKLASLLDDDEE